MEEGAEVDLGDGDHDECLSEREAAVYSTYADLGTLLLLMIKQNIYLNCLDY